MPKNTNRPGYKKTKVGWIPNDWDCVPFARLFEEVRVPVTPVANDLYREIGVRSHGKGIFHKEAVTGESLGDKRVFRCQPGALVFNIVFAWEQAVAVLSESEKDFIASHRFPMFKGHKGKAVEDYFLLFFKTRRGKELLTIASPGGAGRNKTLGQKDLETLPIPRPTLAEQNAIAEILACWDKAIWILEQKIDKKRVNKTKTSQKLLSGKFRLSGYSDNWMNMCLKSIAKLSAGGTPSTKHPEYWNGKIPWMSSGDLNLRRVYAVQGRITEKGLANSSAKFIPKHSVLIGLAGQGRTRGTVAINEIELCTNQSVAAIVPNERVAYYQFLFSNLDSRYVELRKLSAGDGGRGGLTLSLLGGLSILLPSLEEQRAIAEILSTADAEIEVLERKLALIKEQRRFLLNNLVTGTIRLPQFRRKGGRHE